MGCCVSTNNNEAEASSISKKKKLVNAGSDEVSKLKGFSHESRAPPPSAEEETVKEVLSETPKPKPIPQPEPNFTSYVKQEAREPSEEEIKNSQKTEIFAKVQDNQHYENNVDKEQQLSGNEEIMSEASEICSLSMSESLSTMTNITDKRDNEEEQEVKQQRVSRSPARFQPRNGVKNRVVNQSPTRRSDQSPVRRANNGSIRLVQRSREESGQRRGSTTSNRGRRDPGESSGRRSRSPGTTRSTAPLGRSPSGGRANRSPSRAKSNPIESSNCINNHSRRANPSPSRAKSDPIESSNCSNNHSRKVDVRSPEGNWPSTNNNHTDFSTNELLENPLVSLECFIFL